ncbi:MAG: DUF1559 domain-containing protein [Planctomycetaceae bacterium]|jgi:hypothetical protein|nr:DUF1559 domain-containing protein [Planctomycetaceae bacterium]
MKPLIPFFVFLFAPLGLFASEPQWEKFLQEETLLIAHVDLTKIDVVQTIQNNEPIVDALSQVIPGAAGKKFGRAYMEQTLNILKAYLTQALGIQEAYIIVQISFSHNYFAIILPQTGKIKEETLQAAIAMGLPNDSLKVMTTKDNQYVVILAGYFPGGSDEVSDDEWNRRLEQFIPPVPKQRSDFAEAFSAIDDAPIKIAAVMPDFARKVIRDTAPKMVVPFEKVDIVTPLSGLHWLAVSIDPAKSSINVTAAMTSELVVANTLKVLQETFALSLDKLIVEMERRQDDFSLKALLPDLKEKKDRFSSLLIPKAEGKNLVLRWGKQQLSDFLELAMPAIEAEARFQAASMEIQPCVKNMKTLVLAFHTLHSVNDKLPPPFTVDNNGKPLHSWRVLVLPYVEQSALYESIRLNEPWDSEYNKQFHDKMPAVFRCPSGTGNPNRDTIYCMVVGNETVGVPDGKGISLYKVEDGTSNTIALVERATPVCWMEPVDVLQEHAYLGVNKHKFGIGSEHKGGVVVGFLDGSSRFIKDTISLDVLKAILTKAGGEVYSFDF